MGTWYYSAADGRAVNLAHVDSLYVRQLGIEFQLAASYRGGGATVLRTFESGEAAERFLANLMEQLS